MTASSSVSVTWTPSENLRERLKRILWSPKYHLRRIVARELRRGEPELRHIRSLVDPARSSIDIGANRGIWSDCLARLCPQVFAFEPNPKMFGFLKSACAEKVTCSPVALSDRSGIATLRIPRTARGFSNQQASLARRADNRFSEFGEVQVKTARLDDLDLPSCGFIKIDVEGHEAAVLEGARALIARDRPVLLIEMEQRHTGEPIEHSLKRVTDLGYSAGFLREGKEVPIEAFDPDAHHRACVEQPGYVFNFIFRPQEGERAATAA